MTVEDAIISKDAQSVISLDEISLEQAIFRLGQTFNALIYNITQSALSVATVDTKRAKTTIREQSKFISKMEEQLFCKNLRKDAVQTAKQKRSQTRFTKTPAIVLISNGPFERTPILKAKLRRNARFGRTTFSKGQK